MKKITVKIDGMMCGMCEAHVQDAIRKAFDVKSVKASKAKKNAVIVSEAPLPEEELRRTIDATGYSFISYTSEPYEKSGFHLFGKR
jgi:copper chaperone CopZ